jgi:hypothetical protein
LCSNEKKNPPLSQVLPKRLAELQLRNVVGEAVAQGGLGAVEVAAGDQVDDAGHGVRAVDRRGAVGDHLDAADRRGRDLVQVAQGLDDAVGRQAAAVQQQQGGFGADAAQVGGADGRGVGGRVLCAAAEGVAASSAPRFSTWGSMRIASLAVPAPLAFSSSMPTPMVGEPAAATPRMLVPVTTISETAVSGSVVAAVWA